MQSKNEKARLSASDKDRERRYKANYGITLEQYEKMLKRQNGNCAICRKPPKKTRLAVDHDHKTLRVRGLLDWFCNHRFLGRGRERPDMHERAAVYLASKFDGRNI